MSIYAVLLIILCNMACWRASKVLATLFAIELGATQFYIGILVALYSLFPMLLALYAGKLSDRLGVRLVMPAMVKRRGADLVLTVSLFIGATAYLAFPWIADPRLLSTIAFVLGLGMGCGQPLTLIYNRAPPGRSGEAIGLRMTLNNFTHIVMPLFFGSLGTAFGVAPVFVVNAFMLAGGGLISNRK